MNMRKNDGTQMAEEYIILSRRPTTKWKKYISVSGGSAFPEVGNNKLSKGKVG